MDKVIPHPDVLEKATQMAWSDYYGPLFAWWTLRLATGSQIDTLDSINHQEGFDFIGPLNSKWYEWVATEALFNDYTAWDTAAQMHPQTFANRIWWLTGQPNKQIKRTWNGDKEDPKSLMLKRPGLIFKPWRWHYEHHLQIRISAGLIS